MLYYAQSQQKNKRVMFKSALNFNLIALCDVTRCILNVLLA